MLHSSQGITLSPNTAASPPAQNSASNHKVVTYRGNPLFSQSSTDQLQLAGGFPSGSFPALQGDATWSLLPVAGILWEGMFPQVYQARIWTIRQACNHPQCCLQGDIQHTRRCHPKRVFVSDRGTCQAAQAKLGVLALRKGPLSPYLHCICSTSTPGCFSCNRTLFKRKKAQKTEGRLGCQRQAPARQSSNTRSITLYERCRHCII